MAPFIAVMLLGFAATTLQANVITNGCAATNASCTLDELVGGGSIVIDDKLFDDWFINDSSTAARDLGLIEVLALDDQPVNPGLMFNANGEISVAGFDVIDLTFGFRVTTLDASTPITGNSLEINGFTFGPGNLGGVINIWEDVMDVNGGLIGEEFVTADNFTPFLDIYDSAIISAQSQISIEKTIFLSGDDLSDTVSLDSFTQRFVTVPEPSTLWLLVIGLAGFGLARKK